ncbi:MAG: hypothetical protein HC878_14960 [Leptolyngbyaceae cyanobacterium SL_5_14]|nr:hypothetical protein [Leptolyngbyaceae cyanobacterium SL_5_14]
MMHLDELHNLSSEVCEGMEFNSAEEAFLYAEQLSKAGSSSEDAIAAYTCAIQLDPQMAKAYVFRSVEFALTPGQEHLGIEDVRKAAEILRAQGNEEMARAMDQQVESIQGLIAERERGLALKKHYGIEVPSAVDENWLQELRENSTRPWSEKRGIESIDHQHQIILVRVPLDILFTALEDRAIASQQDVLNSEIEISGPFAFAYQIPGQDWSVVTTGWNSSLLERATLAQLSEELGHPVIVLEVGEGEISYDWFEAGALVEHFVGQEGEPYEEYKTEGLQTQQYVLAPDPEDPAAFQTVHFWSSRRSITAKEIGNIWNFVEKLLFDAEAFDPAIDYEYLLGTYSPKQGNFYRVQNPGFIRVYPSGEETFVPDLGRVDYFKFER